MGIILTAHSDINWRLENWAFWLRSLEWKRGSNSITGIICENMRQAVHGGSASVLRDEIDAGDAELIERVMRAIIKPKRDTLRLHYVEHARWQIVCRRAHVRVSREHFDMVMRQAREAVEAIVSKMDSNFSSRH